MYLRCGIYTKICMYNVQYNSDGTNFNDVLYNHAYYYI